MSTTTKTLQPTSWGILSGQPAMSSSGSSTNLSSLVGPGSSAPPVKAEPGSSTEAHGGTAAPAAVAPAAVGSASGSGTGTPLWQAPLYASAGGNNFIPGDAVDLDEIFWGAWFVWFFQT